LRIRIEHAAQARDRTLRVALRFVEDDLDLRGFAGRPGFCVIGRDAQHEVGVLVAHGALGIGWRVLDLRAGSLQCSDEVGRVFGAGDRHRQRLVGLGHSREIDALMMSANISGAISGPISNVLMTVRRSRRFSRTSFQNTVKMLFMRRALLPNR
jgi:hypothetical protein